MPVFSACVGDATRDAGFVDTEGLVAEAAINCIAYYGITRGRSAERFDAGSEVTRSQMALFLYRAAGVAGVDLMGGSGAADFADIAGLDEERRDAIVALARNGILAGSGMAFRPDVSITRAEMAVALVGFLRHASPGLFHQDGAMAGQLVLGSGGTLDHFADARSGVPQAVDTAISYAFELGITTGSAAGASLFSPGGPVLRKNMASFITRTLAHTKVRPAGVTAQADGGIVVVSVRDATFAPVAGAMVDGFYVDSQRRYRAFDLRGGCNAIVRSVNRTSTKCVIDARDPVTAADGDVRMDELSAAAIGRGVTVWVWTGSRGTRYSADVDVFELRIAGEAGAATAPAATAVPAAPSGGGGGSGGGGSTPATTTTTTTTTAPATTTTTTTATTTTTTTTTSTTTTTVPQVAAELLNITADDTVIAATKMTDSDSHTYYEMKFGDWSRFTVQLQHIDENDNDAVKSAAFGKDGTNPVILHVLQQDAAKAATRLSVTAKATVAATNVGVFCGESREACGTWTSTHVHDLKTDSDGMASFVVAAPADPDSGSAGDVATLMVWVVEEINGPAYADNPYANKRLHLFYVKVTEGARTTSGAAPTTTVASGAVATGIDVRSKGADKDIRFPSGDTFKTVSADFGEKVTVTVQLKDTDYEDTTTGVDGTGPAVFNVQRMYLSGGHPTRITRKKDTLTYRPKSLSIVSSDWIDKVTGADGSLTFSVLMEDPDAGSSGTQGSVVFIVRRKGNAPAPQFPNGGIIRYSEP